MCDNGHKLCGHRRHRLHRLYKQHHGLDYCMREKARAPRGQFKGPVILLSCHELVYDRVHGVYIIPIRFSTS